MSVRCVNIYHTKWENCSTFEQRKYPPFLLRQDLASGIFPPPKKIQKTGNRYLIAFPLTARRSRWDSSRLLVPEIKHKNKLRVYLSNREFRFETRENLMFPNSNGFYGRADCSGHGPFVFVEFVLGSVWICLFL